MPPQAESSTRIKNYIHAAQGCLIALSLFLTLVIFTRNGHSDGRTGWFFALCWLSIPILIYLVAVPMWPRVRRFGNVYAFVALDALSIVLWLSAWAAVAGYVSAGKAAGKKDKASGCDNFGFGSAGRCKLSEGTIFLGVLVMLLFVATCCISVQSVMEYRRTGTMPSPADANDFATQTQEAFSSNIRHDEFDEEGGDLDARQSGRIGYQPQRQSMDDEHALLHQGDHEDISQIHPTQPHGPLNYGLNSPNMTEHNTSYGGAYGQHSPNPMESPGFEDPPPLYGR